jgi:hypothetical protein
VSTSIFTRGVREAEADEAEADMAAYRMRQVEEKALPPELAGKLI